MWDGNVVGLAPGVVFRIDHHPRADLDPSKKLLVTGASFEGTKDGDWIFGGEAHFAAEPFAPIPQTPKPRIAGVQSATVVGPAGDEIYCDELGRVRVQFPWDREGKRDERSSCWMRVSQAWAGAGFGCVQIPRVGQEVLVAFYDGDPDQPVVVGRSHNTTQPVPYPLPAHKTKSTWKSDSTPRADGYNEIRYDDAQARELVYLQAQRNLQKLVKRNETERTGHNRFVVVGKNRHAVVAASHTTLVGERWQLQIVEPPSEEDLKVLQQGEPAVSPRPTKLEMVDERVMTTTGPAQVVLHGKTVLLECKGGLSLKAGGNLIIQGGPYVRIN
jgi:type VI secretion system secreted protein VgrG